MVRATLSPSFARFSNSSDLHMEASTILTGKLAPNFFRER